MIAEAFRTLFIASVALYFLLRALLRPLDVKASILVAALICAVLFLLLHWAGVAKERLRRSKYFNTAFQLSQAMFVVLAFAKITLTYLELH